MRCKETRSFLYCLRAELRAFFDDDVGDVFVTLGFSVLVNVRNAVAVVVFGECVWAKVDFPNGFLFSWHK